VLSFRGRGARNQIVMIEIIDLLLNYAGRKHEKEGLEVSRAIEAVFQRDSLHFDFFKLLKV
jgi:hypothetical protein